MKVIFLDHQGVMYIKPHPNPGKLDDFDINTIKVLNSVLLTDSTIEIVVASDWKYWCSLEEMGDFYQKQGNGFYGLQQSLRGGLWHRACPLYRQDGA